MLGATKTANIQRRVWLAILVATVFASGCANPLSAKAKSESSTEKFCETARKGEAQLERAFASEPTDNLVKEVNQTFRDTRDLLSSNAPSQVDEYLATQIELSDNGVEGLFDQPDDYSEAKAAEQAALFEDYIEETCAPETDASTPNGSDTTTPQTPESTTILSDGPSGNFEEVTIDIGKVHTTTDPVGFLTGEPEEPSEQAHLLVEIDLESQIDESNQFQAQDFKLQLSDGKIVAATSLLDSRAKSSPPSLQGKDSASTVAVFETDSAITSLSGLAVGVDREEHVPLYLPLEGSFEPSYPVALTSGQTAQIAGKHPADICDTLFDVKVKSAKVELETFADAATTGRANRETRFVAITLEMTNVTDVREDTASRRQSCGFYSGQLVKTNIRLLVGDKPISNQTASFRWPTIAIGSAEDIELLYEIPLETVEITLIGHEDKDVIASWDLILPEVPGEA